MQITHEQARTWIHLASDESLNIDQKQMLRLHLDLCGDCRKYADGIQNMESLLRPLLQRQWNQQPVPLSIGGLISRGHSRTPDARVMATRIAAMCIMFLTFVFSAWQFSSLGSRSSSPGLANVPSMPMPLATSLTSTQTVCGSILYVVGKNDTLASIASQFSMPVEEIILSNSLTSNTMITGQELAIPICTSTPTAIVEPINITFTPNLERVTSTPGG